MGFAVVAGILVLLTGQSARDAFTAHHDAAAALNALSQRFTISIDANRRTFRVGERISLVLTYDDVPNRRSAGGPCTHAAVPVLDRTAGTGDPLRDIYRTGLLVPGGVCGCSEGGVAGVVPAMIGGVEYDANGLPSLVF